MSALSEALPSVIADCISRTAMRWWAQMRRHELLPASIIEPQSSGLAIAEAIQFNPPIKWNALNENHQQAVVAIAC